MYVVFREGWGISGANNVEAFDSCGLLLYGAGDRKKYMAPVNATYGLFPDLGVCVFKN